MAKKPSERADEPEADDGAGAAARKPFLLRLPAPLMEELRTLASREVRSLNGEIEYLLREALKARRKGG